MLPARIGLGAALAATGQLDAAIDEDIRALGAAPDNAALRLNLAQASYKKGDLSRARREAEAVLAAQPHDLAAAVLLGSIYSRLDRYAEAAALLAPLEAGHESNMELEYVLAYSLIQTGQFEQGVSRMEKVAKATHSANAWVIAGAARLSRSEMSQARADLEAALQLNPSSPGVQSMLGQARYALQDMAGATLACQAALRENPRDFNANLDLGAIRLQEHKYDDARPLLELALELQPASPIARLEIAKLNAKMGDYAKAIAELEELVKAEPDWLDAHWELAAAYFEADRPEDGKRERAVVQQLRLRQQTADPHAN
jgi:tetratricopeptide (TPR) repeat protein